MASSRDGAVYRCAECGTQCELALDRVRCECGGVLDLVFDAPAFPDTFLTRDVVLGRYREAIPVDPVELERASLGAGRTPMLALGHPRFVKCDFLMPSGSFKDRGAQVLVALARSLGAARAVVDSSGNAGAAIAAHCARIGMPCVVVVPSSAPIQKLSQSRGYGATVLTVEGGRDAAAEVANSLALEGGSFYASHVENPFFMEGMKTWAFEVWEQLGDAPAEVVMSVGNGSLLLGAAKGFRYLFDQGLTTRIPRMIAVQAKGWSALSGDLNHGVDAPLADGIAISAPRRLKQILGVVESTRGAVRTVSDEEIRNATLELTSKGIWVEPTSGAAWAGSLASLSESDGPIVVSLGGAGFKVVGGRVH